MCGPRTTAFAPFAPATDRMPMPPWRVHSIARSLLPARMPTISPWCRPCLMTMRGQVPPLPVPKEPPHMLRLTRWCISHRRQVIVAWILIAVVTTVVAGAVGRQYASNFTLPGTESQRVADLLNKEFPAQKGEFDTIWFHPSKGTIDESAVRRVIEPLLAKVSRMPHVQSVVSPYGPAGAVEVAKDRRTAFATVNYDERANLLPDNAGKPVLTAVSAVKVSGLEIAAGGQVIEQAEGFNIGPATSVGVIA